MKKLFVLLLFSIGIDCVVAQDKIIFDYDAAGNQVERELCINCPLAGKKVKDSKEITKEDFITSEVSDEIAYYPNPVKEELYLTWELVNDKKVESVTVYAINGQTLHSFQKTENVKLQIIPFQSYPTGVYAVVLKYNNGEQKSIKIIKR